METIALILTAVACTGTGAWAVRSGMSGLERSLGALKEALAIHVVEERHEREKLAERVERLEEKL